jgi:hypothetical protein
MSNSATLAWNRTRLAPARGWCAAPRWAGLASLCVFICLAPASPVFSRQEQTKPQREPKPASQASSAGVEPEEVAPCDWGPNLLDGILSSPNNEAQSAMVRAAFAAGPAIIPQLSAALKDDRTAEYAAQSLAYIGGNEALPALWKLLSDPRDLNLRRFTYGALAESESPQAAEMLFDVIGKSDSEPDRTVTESAVIALTVRTDPSLVPRILALEKKLQDVVIRDDLDNARTVIEERAKYLATPRGKKSGGSIESAVRTYFIPALEPPPEQAASQIGKVPGKLPIPPTAKPSRPAVSVDVRTVTFSPDKNRALARVTFEDPSATAYYDFVLEKRYGNWTLASVWLGPEVEKAGGTIRQ